MNFRVRLAAGGVGALAFAYPLMGGMMEKPTDREDGASRANLFLFGDYPGAPVDYVMAIAIVFAMIAVLMAGLIRDLLPEIGTVLLYLIGLLPT